MRPSDSPFVLSYSAIDLYSLNRLVKEWNIDFIQLGSGRFKGKLTQVLAPNFQMAYAHFNTKVKQEGSSPPSHWTFAFVNDIGLNWRNFEVKPESIIVYAPNSKINAVSDEDFDVYTFSISEEALMDIARKKGVSSFVEKLNQIEILETNSPLWADLREALKSAVAKFEEQAENSESFENVFALAPFVKNLLTLMIHSEKSAIQVSNASRLEVLSNAEALMNIHDSGSIHIKEIASRVGVSERTLLYSFKKRYGIGPKAFMKIINLNRVYVDLRTESETTISSIAREHGFWHLGQFVKDFKEMFDEVPSKIILKEEEPNIFYQYN